MLALALTEARAAAGAVVRGQVERPDDSAPVAVELVRLERSPIGVTTCYVTGAELQDDGTFALTMPDRLPPDVDGEVCSLHYAVRVVAGQEEARQALVVGS
jgi:hypothetical protein